jgi:hypothetical protein
LWNNDLATLVKKDLNAWVAAKTAAVSPITATPNTAACTADEASKLVSAVKASPNLGPCSKDAGFEFIDFFAEASFLPSAEQIKAAAGSTNCAALVKDANGLKLDFTCQLWNNDLATLVKKDLNAWVTAKKEFATPTSALPSSSAAVMTITASIVPVYMYLFF